MMEEDEWELEACDNMFTQTVLSLNSQINAVSPNFPSLLIHCVSTLDMSAGVFYGVMSSCCRAFGPEGAQISPDRQLLPLVNQSESERSADMEWIITYFHSAFYSARLRMSGLGRRDGFLASITAYTSIIFTFIGQ